MDFGLGPLSLADRRFAASNAVQFQNTPRIGNRDFLTARILAFWHEVPIIGTIANDASSMSPEPYEFRSS